VRRPGAIAGNVTNAGGAIAPGGVSKPGDAAGVLTITGNLIETQPSELDILLGTSSSQLIVDGTAALLGNLDVSLAEGFSLTSGGTFDIVGTGDGLTNGLTSLSFNGAACSTDGDAFKCNGGDVFDIFSWSVVPGITVGGTNPEDLVLSVTTTPVPEASTWAMMLIGFAGLGFAGWRAQQSTTVAA
jgi:hypothetical protein